MSHVCGFVIRHCARHQAAIEGFEITRRFSLASEVHIFVRVVVEDARRFDQATWGFQYRNNDRGTGRVINGCS